MIQQFVESITKIEPNDSPTTALPPESARIDTRRNLFAYIADIHFFNLGTYFAPVTTILVALASRLTTDNFLIGLISPAWSAGWALPQLFVAHFLHGKTKMKPYVVIPGLIGRQTYFFIAFWIAFTQAKSPNLTVWLLILAVLIFSSADALATVAWFDMLSRNLSARARSRVFAGAQLASSLLGLAAGVFVIAPIFSADGLPFPLNYAAVIGIAWACFLLSWIGILFVREKDGEVVHKTEAELTEKFSKLLWKAVRSDQVFRRTLVVRLFTAFEFMAATFYIVFIQQRLNLPDSSTATLNLALTSGSIVGLAAFGWIADRAGSRRVMQLAAIAQFLAPFLAFIVAVVPAIADQFLALALGLFVVVMAFNGVVGHSTVLGFLNYTLEIAPPAQRAIYIGTFNTLQGLMALTPPLAGLFINAMAPILSIANTYSILFGVIAALVALGAVISLKLPATHSRGAASD